MLVLLCFGLASRAYAQFETRGAAPVLGDPAALAVGDFNHDGKLDVAVAAFYSGQVAVLLGRGDGTFLPAVYYSIDSQLESVYWLVAADFNRDGNLDLAVADYLGNDISVLLGNGDGSFQPPVKQPTTGRPTSVAVGDFNNDGKPDLLVCDAPYVSVMLGNGDGTFQSPIDTTPSVSPLAVSLGDFNGDGKLDAASVGGGEVTILLGNGHGDFTEGTSYPAGIAPESLVAGNFGGNRKLDLAVADLLGSQIMVFRGNGDGTFQAPQSYSVPFPWPIEAADLNGDQKLDLLVPTSGLGTSRVVSVLLGNGDGTFQSPEEYPTGKEPFFVTAGDFNGDHKADLIVADELGSTVGVLLNTGVVSFSPTTPLTFVRQVLGTKSSPESVTLTNTGTAALSINSMYVSGPFHLAGGTTCAASVAAGESCTIAVSFKPTAEGASAGLVTILDSASSKPQVIELSGLGTVIKVSPTQLTFPAQKVGTKSAPQTATITNTGSTAVTVNGVNIAGRNLSDYAQTNTCGSSIAAGASCKVTVTFTPGAKGTRTATAEINDNGGGSPQGILLTGTGS